MQEAVVVDERQLLDAVLLQDRLGLLERGAHVGGDQPVGRHELGDRPVEVGAVAEADVAVGEDADEAPVGVGDRHAAELEAVHQLPRRRAASPSAGSVTGSVIIPLWLRLTFCTSAAWSAIDRLRWITPMPPSRAMAIAMRASVTLSIAADTSGTASSMSAAKRGRGVDRVGQHVAVAGDDDDVVEGQRLEAVEQLVVAVADGHAGAPPSGVAERGEGGDEQAVLGGVHARR